MIREIVDGELTPMLTRYGFQKFGKNNPSYHRSRDERVEIVDVQGGKANRRDDGTFTVNVAVFFPTLDPIVTPYPVDGRPGEVNCPVRVRISQLDADGRLLPEWTDRWWSFDPATDVAALGAEVAGAVEARALPFLDRLAPREDLLASIRAGQPRVAGMWVAAIAAWAGDAPLAERLLEAELRPLSGRMYGLQRRRAAIIAQGLGLDLPGPDSIPEHEVKVTVLHPPDSSRDEHDEIYWTLYSGLTRTLPEDGPDYLQHITGVRHGRVEARLYGPDPVALAELIRPLLDEVAALPAGTGHPVCAVDGGQDARVCSNQEA
jgi:hypothetical protein